jgi:hypothetical protein
MFINNKNNYLWLKATLSNDFIMLESFIYIFGMACVHIFFQIFGNSKTN